MDELRDLYQEVILDHNKNPRHFGVLQSANRKGDGKNPLCGDHYTVYLLVEDSVIKDLSFEGSGCAISKASASVMSETLIGKSVAEAEELFELFQKLVRGELDPVQHLDELGKLAAFSGVSEFPVRVKCATIAWHALHSALHDSDVEVSTE